MLSDVAELFSEIAVQPAADRRLTQRFVDAWARAAQGRFPSWTELYERDLGDDWDWVFAVDIEKSVGFPYFIFLGDALSKLSDVFLTGCGDWTLSLLERAAGDIDAAVAAAAPHHREDVLQLCDGRRILLRGVTAPLAEDGVNISHVAGAVRGKFIDYGSTNIFAVN